MKSLASLLGKGTVIGDVISPALTPEDWDLADGLAVSDMTLLEVGTLVSRGRIRLSISLESFLQEIEARFVVFPITGRAYARAMAFPATYPKDPADRIIGSHRTRRRALPDYGGPRNPSLQTDSHDL